MTQLDAWTHAFHLTVPDHWLNDPQRPVYAQGAYQYFYLYNADYPEPSGTSWRRVSTTDGMRFTDHGVALDKHAQRNGGLWTGCLVVDDTNSAGFGEGAVIAIVTQIDSVGGGDGQAQFLWFSTDDGSTFEPYSDAPVLANRGYEHFRDPKIVRVGESWVMALAEDTDIGLYSSRDLKTWTEISRFHEDRIGMLECPDLFEIVADDGSKQWVLAASPQRSDPERSDRPGTYAYWVGEFDGSSFAPTEREPKWLDFGFDWYAAVTWPVHSDAGIETKDKRLAIGWMNNWAYADQNPPTWTEGGYHGINSVVRELTLVRADGGYELISRPLRETESPRTPLEAIQAVQSAPSAASITARILPSAEGSGFRVKCSQDGERAVEVLVTPSEIRVNRRSQGCPGDGSLALARAAWRGGPVDIEILVDRATVEVFADGGRIALSMLSFAPVTDTGLQIVGPVGSVTDAAVAPVAPTAIAAVPASN